MLLRPRAIAASSLLCLVVIPTPSSAGVGGVLGYPFRWLGGQLVQGGADRLKGTIQDVDLRLQTHEARLSDLIGDTKELVGDTKAKLDDTVDKVDRGLEARILQLKMATDDSVKQALTQVDDTLRRRLIQANSVGQNLIQSLDKTVVDALGRADTLLRDRTAELERAGNGIIEHANAALQSRISQIDEVAGRRLANVDVLATKQRIQLEKGVLRVAVLVAVVGIVTFVVITIWKRYEKLQSLGLSGVRGAARTALYLREFLPAVLKGLLGAASAVGVMLALYAWLPRGPNQEAAALALSHQAQLADAVLRVDYPTARLHASNLQYLLGSESVIASAQADMTALMRDIIDRPTLLAAPSTVTEFVGRLNAIERALDGRPDPNVLSLRAFLAWRTGSTRRAELEAASYSARALRLAPRGFAMAPLARAQLRIFLNAPYLPESRELGRDALTLEELETALADSEPESRLSPFAPMAELAQLMSALERDSSQLFVSMLDAHLRADFSARTTAAEAIVRRWEQFDLALLANPAFGDGLVLNIFRLNDAVLTHARWFLVHRNSAELPVPLESLPRTPAGVELRLLLVPARVVWARRYETLFQGAARALAEFEEAERFRVWERWTIEFEQATLASSQAPADAVARWRLVVAASALSLYVTGSPVPMPYAALHAQGLLAAPDVPPTPAARLPRNTAPAKQMGRLVPETPDAPATLAAALATRGPRML
jgi:hypothetical protein